MFILYFAKKEMKTANFPHKLHLFIIVHKSRLMKFTLA